MHPLKGRNLIGQNITLSRNNNNNTETGNTHDIGCPSQLLISISYFNVQKYMLPARTAIKIH
jgi:hypothetical protein